MTKVKLPIASTYLSYDYMLASNTSKKAQCVRNAWNTSFLGYIFNFLYIALNLLLRFRGGKITTNKENSWLFLIEETWFINGYEFSEDRIHEFKNKA